MKNDRITKLLLVILIILITFFFLLSVNKKSDPNLNLIVNQVQTLQQKINTLQDDVHQDQQKAQPVVANGINGTNGLNGTPGTAGLSAPSVQGSQGIQGQQGQTGLSAYDLWLSVGNIGTIDDFLTSIHGQDGQPGPAGRTEQWRCNPLTLNEEMRYVGDALYKPAFKVVGCP